MCERNDFGVTTMKEFLLWLVLLSILGCQISCMVTDYLIFEKLEALPKFTIVPGEPLTAPATLPEPLPPGTVPAEPQGD